MRQVGFEWTGHSPTCVHLTYTHTTVMLLSYLSYIHLMYFSLKYILIHIHIYHR